MGAALLGMTVLINADDAKVTSMQSSLKVGYVAASAILNESDLGKGIKKELEEKYHAVARELQEEEQKIMKANAELQAKRSTINEQVFEAEQNKLKEMARQFEYNRQTKADELRTAEGKANERLVLVTLEVAGDIGQKDGYDLITDKDSGKPLYVAAKVDCTSKFIQSLNEKVRKDSSVTAVAAKDTKAPSRAA